MNQIKKNKMKPKTQRAGGLIGRCLLAGVMFIAGCGDYYSLSQEERFKKDEELRNSFGLALIAGGLLDSSNNTPQQNQSLRSLGVGGQNYQRNQAIRNSGKTEFVPGSFKNSHGGITTVKPNGEYEIRGEYGELIEGSLHF